MTGFTNDNYKALILVFFITGIWDVILRKMSEGYIKFFGIENMKWVRVLQEYFKEHTLLSAGLLAAFVGAIAYALIIYTLKTFDLSGNFQGILITSAVSGLLGIPMRYSGLFPVLKEHYYDKLGFWYSFGTDTFSGIVVAVTLYLIEYFKIFY